jgi:hypothetical protein
MTSVNPSRRTLSRRALLAAAGGIGIAVSSLPFLGIGTATANVEDSPRFDIGGTGGNPILKKRLHANWVMQSFGYDNVNNHVYFLQTNVDNTDPARVGDLWVTQTDLAGNELGAMALHNFGHGVSIGVEPYNGTVYLWTEWQANPTSGFGTKLGRFEFVNGATLEADDPAIQDRTPSIGDPMINPQPAIDPSTDRLLVRYHVDADMPRIVAISMSDARAGLVSTDYRIAERALPSRGNWGVANPFQGFTAYGRYAYLLEGPVGSPSYITTIDLNDAGQSIVEDRYPTAAGASLPGREPQGMTIWLAGAANAVSPRLAFGFHSNTDGVRQATVLFKDQFHS